MMILSSFLTFWSYSTVSVSLGTTAPGNVFAEDEPLRWEFAGGAPVEAVIEDYRGAVVWQGTLNSGEVIIPAQPRGYYEWVVGDARMAFAVVPPPKDRITGESTLATDAAHSWLVKPADFEKGAALLRLAGFGWARERIRWGEVQPRWNRDSKQPERGNFIWGRYDLSADAAARQEIKVYQIFHDTPGWARADHNSKCVADDLRDVYHFAKETASHFRGRVQAWEVWNEPDIQAFADEPGDAFAAHTKAAALGFKAGDPDTLVLMPSLAMGPGKFAEQLFINGAIAYCDLYNYHIYAPPEKYAERARAHFALMARYGFAEMLAWLTEAGIRLEHTPEELLTKADQRRQAEFVPKSYVASLASGVDKHFFFVFPHYLERGIEFGVLRSDLTPYPGYVALATLTYALGRGSYLGKLTAGVPESVQAHLFDRGEGQALVIWADEGFTSITLPLRGDIRHIDLMGREETHTAQGTLQLEVDAPCYLLFADEGFHKLCDPPPSRPANERVADRFELNEVVVRLNFPGIPVDKANERYRMPSPSIDAQIEVYQFGGNRFDGTLELDISGAGRMEPEQYRVAVDSMERAVIPVRVHATEDAREMQLRAIAKMGASESAPAIAELIYK